MSRALVVAITTDLRRNRPGRRIAGRLCRLIEGADVADFTPGHTVYGSAEVVLRVCPSRPRRAYAAISRG